MHAFHQATDPTATDDDGHGFKKDDLLFNTVSRRLFECEDPATGAAVWVDITKLIAPDAAVVDDRVLLFDGTGGIKTKQGAKTGTQVADHLDSTANPHGVTAAQSGAAPASHVTDTSNPHGVTAAQSGAAPAAHVSDTANPHAVTAVQVGAIPATRTITAGAGLTGGGDLSADRTIDAAANADGSIVVNADDLQVGVLATDAQHGARGGGTQHAAAIAAGVAGFMTGAQVTKLDGIEAAAKDDQSAAEVPFTPDGDIAAAVVQTAIVEVRDDTDTKLASKSDTGHAHAHSAITGQTANDHHDESHTLGSHTGTIADIGGDTAGTARPPTAHTIVSHDTVATGADLDVMVGGGDANGLHTHAPAQLFIWGFSTNTAAADPGAGRVRANNATPASITALYFSSLDAAGLDFDNFFAMIPVGDTLLAQQTDDASKRLLLTVGTLVDEGGWWTVPVTVDADAGGLFGNNKDTSWLIRMRM